MPRSSDPQWDLGEDELAPDEIQDALERRAELEGDIMRDEGWDSLDWCP